MSKPTKIPMELWLVIDRHPDHNEVRGYFLSYDAALQCYNHVVAEGRYWVDACFTTDLVHMVEDTKLRFYDTDRDIKS